MKSKASHTAPLADRPLDPAVPRGRSMGWTILLGLLVLGVAVLAGSQIAAPDKRVLQVFAAFILVFFAFRIDSISALAIAVIFLPFPKATSYGNTNVTFVLLIFIVWLFRVTTGRIAGPRRLPVMTPVMLLVMSYAISFYNVEHAHYAVAWAKYMAFLSYLFLAFMVVNVVRTESDVKKLLYAQVVACFLVCCFGMYEQNHAGGAIIPGWIEFTDTADAGHGVRIGSTFLDYELFAEFCALNLILQIFLFTRATTRSRKFALAGIMFMTLYCLFGTVTRGALVAFTVGLIYLTWLSRARISFPKLVVGIAAFLTIVIGGDVLVAKFTKSGSVLDRLTKTEFVNGVPDSRVGAWEYATKYIAEHPIIGHGTYYSIERGLESRWWPHNLYLYYPSIVGLTGLSFFLWFLWELLKLSRPRAPSLGSGTFLEGATLAFRVMLVIFMVDQTKIEYLRNERYSFFIWFFFGLIIAVCSAAKAEALGRRDATAPEVRRSSAPAASRPLAVAPRPAVPPLNR